MRDAIKGMHRVARDHVGGDGGVVGMVGKEHTALAGCDALFQRPRPFAGCEDLGHAQKVQHRQTRAQHKHQRGQLHRQAAGWQGGWQRHGFNARRHRHRHSSKHSHGRSRARRPVQRKAPGPGRGQQEIAVPEWIFDQAVQANHQHHQHRAALRHAQLGRCGPGPLHATPQAPGQQRHHQQRQRQAQFHRQLQRQVVRVVEESHRALGQWRQRPRKVEFTEAHAEPRLLCNQSECVAPDGKTRAGDIAFGQPFTAAKRMLRQRGPLGHGQP